MLATTRWKLRKAIKAVNEVLAELRVEKHPDKTFIGRIARGFDFLGYWFSPLGLGVAKKTVDRMLDKVALLYEQGADEKRIESYLKRWWQWVRSGVDGVLTRCERARTNYCEVGWSEPSVFVKFLSPSTPHTHPRAIASKFHNSKPVRICQIL